jgi:site-specific DNA-methyltransferase (adenine-specific)
MKKFDVIIGNPPYQEPDNGHGSSAKPLYNIFIEKAIQLNPKYISFVIPSRWFVGGKNLDDFRKKMLSDTRISSLIDYPESGECFPDNDIKGGINYFVWDRDYNGPCKVTNIMKGISSDPEYRYMNKYDTFIRFGIAEKIVDKVLSYNEPTFANENMRKNRFGMNTNFPNYSTDYQPGFVKLYALKKEVWVDPKYIKKNQDLVDKIKILTTEAYGGKGSYPQQVTNKPFMAMPNSCCTATYLVLDTPKSLDDANKIISYLKTKFVRFLISLRKTTQHSSESTYKFVPYPDLSNELTDSFLYKKYNLDNEEIEFIEKMIKAI